MEETATIQTPDSPTQKLYNGLKEKGLYTKTYDDFVLQFSDDAHKQNLYNGLKKQGLYTKSYDDFGNQFGELKKKEPTDNTTTEPKPQSEPISENGNLSSKVVPPPIENHLGDIGGKVGGAENPVLTSAEDVIKNKVQSLQNIHDNIAVYSKDIPKSYSDEEIGRLPNKTEEKQFDVPFDKNVITGDMGGVGGVNPITAWAQKEIENVNNMNLPIADPTLHAATKEVLKSILGSIGGVGEGIQQMSTASQDIKDVKDNPMAMFEFPAAVVKTGFSGLSLVHPGLAAFNLATQTAEDALPSDVVPKMMSPFSTYLQQTHGLIAYKGLDGKFKMYDVGNSNGVKAAAELGDLVWNILLFHGSETLGKKVLNNIPLTPMEQNEVNGYINDAAKDFAQPFKKETLDKIPLELPDDKKVQVAPIIEKKDEINKNIQQLEKDKTVIQQETATLDPAFKEQQNEKLAAKDKEIEKQQAEIKNKDGEIIAILDQTNKTEPIDLNPKTETQPKDEGLQNTAISEGTGATTPDEKIKLQEENDLLKGLGIDVAEPVAENTTPPIEQPKVDVPVVENKVEVPQEVDVIKSEKDLGHVKDYPYVFLNNDGTIAGVFKNERAKEKALEDNPDLKDNIITTEDYLARQTETPPTVEGDKGVGKGDGGVGDKFKFDEHGETEPLKIENVPAAYGRVQIKKGKDGYIATVTNTRFGMFMDKPAESNTSANIDVGEKGETKYFNTPEEAFDYATKVVKDRYDSGKTIFNKKIKPENANPKTEAKKVTKETPKSKKAEPLRKEVKQEVVVDPAEKMVQMVEDEGKSLGATTTEEDIRGWTRAKKEARYEELHDVLKRAQKVSENLDLSKDQRARATKIITQFINEHNTLAKALESSDKKAERESKNKEKAKKVIDKTRTALKKAKIITENDPNIKKNSFGEIDLEPILKVAQKVIEDALNLKDDINEAIKKGMQVIIKHLQNQKGWDELTREEKLQGLKEIHDNLKTELENAKKEEPKVEGEGNVTGITHEQTDEAARSLGLPEYEKNPETFAQWDEEAQQRINNGEMPDLIKKLENGDMPDKVEQRMMAKYAADLLAKVEKNPSDENIKRYGDFKRLSDIVGGREVAKSLVARQNVVPVTDNIADMYTAKMEANGVDVLTPDQKTAIQQEYENIKKLREEAEAKIKESQEWTAKINAQKELNKAKATKKPNEKKTHADYVEERKKYIESAREKLKKLRGGAQATIVPYANELIAIAPEAVKMMHSLIAEGYDKLEDIAKAIYDEFKGDIPDMVQKDIHNILAGDYSKKRPTKGALELQAKDIRDEAKYINQLEALQRGEPKTEKAKVERNQKIKDLQEKIKDFKKELADAEKEQNKKPADQVALERIKKNAEKKTAQLKKDLAEGNFEKNPRTPFTDNAEIRKNNPKLWKETMDAIAAREDAQHEFEIGLLKDEMAKRHWTQKYIVDIGKGIVSTTKALRQGIDDSALFVQNIIALTSHPKSAMKALPGHLKDFWSEKNYTRWLTDLHSRHFEWDLIHKSGLDITDPKSLRQQGREEAFSNNLLDKTFEVKGKKINIGKHTVRPFERMFTSLGNRLRADAFLRMAEKYYAQGKTFETHPKEFTDLAKVLNNETGRGALPKPLENTALTQVLWSPRLLASTLNTLGLSDIFYGAQLKKGYYASLTPRMRVYAAASFAKYIGATMSVIGLMALAGWKPDMNPTSQTFGSVEKDGKRYNMFGRFAGVVRLIAQLSTGKQTQNGLTTKMQNDKRVMLPLHFLRGKVTPVVGTGLDFWTGKTYTGQDVDVKTELLQNVTPLSVSGIVDGLKNEGVSSIFTTGLPSFVGLNISYEADYNRQVPTEIKVGDTKVELNETQQKEFQDNFDEKKANFTTNLQNTEDYKNASDEEKAKMETMVIDAAQSESEKLLREKYPKELSETSEQKKERLKKEKELQDLKKKIGIGKSSSSNTGVMKTQMKKQ